MARLLCRPRQRLGEQLRQVEAELAKRDLATVSTVRLFYLAESLNPCSEEQVRLQQARAGDQEIEALLARVYGPSPPIPQ